MNYEYLQCWPTTIVTKNEGIQQGLKLIIVLKKRQDVITNSKTNLATESANNGNIHNS
jgi:NAD(P)H-hydrate repair Nnr-like enzyme with NAD(P)H-hydrate dehydratase domain